MAAAHRDPPHLQHPQLVLLLPLQLLQDRSPLRRGHRCELPGLLRPQHDRSGGRCGGSRSTRLVGGRGRGGHDACSGGDRHLAPQGLQGGFLPGPGDARLRLRLRMLSLSNGGCHWRSGSCLSGAAISLLQLLGLSSKPLICAAFLCSASIGGLPLHIAEAKDLRSTAEWRLVREDRNKKGDG